jgi:hypothetical protein
MKKLLINLNTNTIENVILVDENYEPPIGYNLQDLIEGADIGDRIVGGEIIKPDVLIIPPTMNERLTAVEEIIMTLLI